MRKTILRMLVLLTLLALTTGGSSQFAFDYREIYFENDWFITTYGYYERDCSNNITQWGTQTNWRRTETYTCDMTPINHHCWHWNGSSWDEVTCPY